MERQDCFDDWYRYMWNIYNDEWNRFMREYVFSPDPPFKLNVRPARILDVKPREDDRSFREDGV
jgi:hypothetical protein